MEDRVLVQIVLPAKEGTSQIIADNYLKLILEERSAAMRLIFLLFFLTNNNKAACIRIPQNEKGRRLFAAFSVV